MNIHDLVEQALYVDGEHHKQWFLVQIAKALGYEDVLKEIDIGFEGGIPP